jgi:hypothetical protein
MSARIALLLVLAAAPAVRARGQGHPRPPLPRELQGAVRTAIDAVADSLEREGLPAEAVVSKAAEGVLKRADDARILGAVRSLAGRLREARRVIGPGASAPELIAGASAFFAGATAAQLGPLVGAQRARPGTLSLAYSLTVLSDLVSNGVPVEHAARSIEDLVARGARDADLGALRAVVESEIRAGRTPLESIGRGAERARRGIEGRPPR